MLNTNTEPPIQPQTNMRLSFVVILLLALIELSVLIWTCYDHSIPCWDTASHKLNSYYVYELLKCPHPSSLHWYRSIFAVSPLYPPFFYIVSALLKFPCGELVNTELLSNLIFIAILFGSLYYITKVTFENKLASLIAPVLVFLYPAVFWSAHSALLDCAANAMVGLGLASYLWWSKSPDRRKSIILGLVLGLSLLTKNNTPIFFVGPFLLDIVLIWQNQNYGKRDFARIKQLCIVALVSLTVILPWLILAGSAVSKFILSIQQQNFHVNNQTAVLSSVNSTNSQFNWLFEFLAHLQRFTLADLPLILSPLLCGCFLIALVKIKPINKNKAYLVASITFAIVLASAFRWPHQFRYIVPTTIPIAALTAGMFAQLWQTRHILWRLILLVIALIASLQFIYAGFNPYPLSLPAWINSIMQMTGEEFKTKSGYGQMPGIAVSPLPNSDSGILWCLSKVELVSAGNPTSLMIMPNANPINCSPFYYLTKIRKDNIEAGSPRQHTELGDKVSFNRQQASWYKWYILKSGDQGIALCDNESAAEYAKWLEFVHSSKLYKLVSKKPLPDDSTLELYGPIKD